MSTKSTTQSPAQNKIDLQQSIPAFFAASPQKKKKKIPVAIKITHFRFLFAPFGYFGRF